MFTLVSWGHMGITGRALVLGAVTLAALAGPALLLKRGLRSTAESVAGLGLALTVLDAYALHEAALAGTDGDGVRGGRGGGAGGDLVGVRSAAGHRSAATAPALRPGGGPVPAVAVGPVRRRGSADVISAALLVTAGLDTVAALRVRTGSVRITAMVGGYSTGALGVLTAGWLSLAADTPSAAARAGALLLLAATIAVGAAWRGAGSLSGSGSGSDSGTAPGSASSTAAPWQGPGEEHALGLAIVSGLLAVGAFGGTARPWLPEMWTVPGLSGLRDRPVGGGAGRAAAGRGAARVAWASGAVQALALLWALPVVAVVGPGPAGWIGRVWSGAPSDARAAVTVEAPWPPDAAAVPVVLLAVAAVVALVSRAEQWRARARIGALGLVWATALTLPVVAGMRYVAGMAVLGVVQRLPCTRAGPRCPRRGSPPFCSPSPPPSASPWPPSPPRP
ncbi:Integral membrane protein OS=Streptomyces violarus OX=67380 GN=FHS41_006231 PE=4 SV=1 [Streptomyces violarus]